MHTLIYTIYGYTNTGGLPILGHEPQYLATEDDRATKAVQAINTAWAVLRDPQKRAAYNHKIVEEAMNAERTQRKRKVMSATAQQQKAQAQASKKPKVTVKTSKPVPPEAPKQQTTATKTEAAHGKTATPSTTAASSSSASKAESWVYCKLFEYKNHVVCKSFLQKQFQRKFEHKPWAGKEHALNVAKAFQKSCEHMMTEALSLTKLDKLKSFCESEGIELPEGKLSKAHLQDAIEQARGSSLPFKKPFQTFSIFCIPQLLCLI